jgi:pimeloyl-ACP methyl ester carboxylesterase
MLPLAAAGYHVIAPDQRGYGRTAGWDDSYDADPDPFRILNMVRDAAALVSVLGYRSVAAVTMPARRSRPGRPSSGPTYSARWR